MTMDMRIRAIRDLTKTLPKNDMGLPTGFYRTDMLPFHDYVPPVGESPLSGLLPPAPDAPTTAPLVNTDPVPDPDSDLDEEYSDWLEQEPNEGEPNEGELSAHGDAFSAHEEPEAPTPTSEPASATATEPEPEVLPPQVHRVAGFPSKELEKAFVWLNYDEGFPTLPGGRPFWGRLDFEPTDAYQAFQAYLRMPFGREQSPDAEEYDGQPASGTRALAELPLHLVRTQISAAELHQLQTCLEEWYHEYYWALRAQAYDLFRVAQHQKQLEIRAIETQDEHYLLAKRLKARLLDYMEQEEQFWDMMTPKVGVDFLKQLTQMERISAGLPAMGPPSEKSEGKGVGSFELAFRKVAQSQNTSIDRHDGSPEDVLSVALTDPESVKVLQELIIKVGK